MTSFRLWYRTREVLRGILFGVVSKRAFEKKKSEASQKELKKNSLRMADQFIVVKKLWKQRGAKNWTVYVEPIVNNP
jgi:hypothetical protein